MVKQKNTKKQLTTKMKEIPDFFPFLAIKYYYLIKAYNNLAKIINYSLHPLIYSNI